MKTTLLGLATVATFAPALAAQSTKAILFTGRFPFVSVDAASNSGSVPQMSEFDFSYSFPLPGSTTGRTLMSANAMHCYLGDGDADGDWLKFAAWKPSYFTNIGIDGVFVKDGVAVPKWSDVYWTPRLDAAATPMEVLTNNGTPVTLVEGDWVRFLPNGNVEFFMTQAQLAVAAGAQPNNDVPAAGAIVQAPNGDLFYAPHDGGHWVNGNSTGQVFCYDGAICKIDAANITYDANGNVASFAPDSARLLINEVNTTTTVRGLVDNAGSFDRTGQPIVTAGIYGKTGGLGLDPNGGTWTSIVPDAGGNFTTEPNLVFCSNAGSYGGTIWTTANGGDVLEINAFGGPGTGVLCGSKTAGVPADGAWLGVQLDVANFQPTLLGMTIIDVPEQPLVADMADYGRLADNTVAANWDLDFYGTPNTAVFCLVDLGPSAPSVVVPSIDLGIVPLQWASDSWPDLFLTQAPISFGVGITDALGYTTVTTPNPHTGGVLSGFTLTVQGLGLAPTGFKLSAPVMVQLQ